jgi:hypothetical protein
LHEYKESRKLLYLEQHEEFVGVMMVLWFFFLCCACSAGAAEQACGSTRACRGTRFRNGMTKTISGRWCIRTHNHDDGTHQKWQGFHHRTSNVRVVTTLDRSCQKWEHQKCHHGQTRIHKVVKPTEAEFHTSIKVLEFKDENGISWVSLNFVYVLPTTMGF